VKVLLHNGKHWHEGQTVRIIATGQRATIIGLYHGATTKGDRASLKLEGNPPRDVKLIDELEAVQEPASKGDAWEHVGDAAARVVAGLSVSKIA